MVERMKESKTSAAERKAKEQIEGRVKQRKLEEAMDLVVICLDSFAFYYYVQRRALAG